MKKDMIMKLKNLLRLHKRSKFTAIDYFSPDGISLPNGIGFHRGAFLHECKTNSNSFDLNDSVYGKCPRCSEATGGIIIFPHSWVEGHIVAFDSEIEQSVDTFNYMVIERSSRYNIALKNFSFNRRINNYYVGNAFKGRYIGDNREEYDMNSATLEVNGLETKDLLQFADFLSHALHQDSILVKDLNSMKIYKKEIA